VSRHLERARQVDAPRDDLQLLCMRQHGVFRRLHAGLAKHSKHFNLIHALEIGISDIAEFRANDEADGALARIAVFGGCGKTYLAFIEGDIDLLKHLAGPPALISSRSTRNSLREPCGAWLERVHVGIEATRSGTVDLFAYRNFCWVARRFEF
jgi:hypothetical protein